ncbi:hypothetical protein [Antrihabitans sp. YC2-6]|uniref:hypothetical protein n=1 Tax=Antrihabitans sp. YC2-6 TaxID=2799498 RepID=UPI0018F58584|nr:hypothetical protein [Antrihabitans sp. YC2-6]MBJ8348173.1 hypothetical protein [Antrihabitans sp. YC2-6]
MTALEVVLLVVAIVAGVLLVVLLVARYVVRAMRRKGAATLEAEFGEGEVQRSDPLANYFGLESRGVKQMRGNGTLVLTRNQLWFRRIGGNEALEIPLGAVVDADIASSHLGKRVGRPLLRVRFETTAGPDVVAWYVGDAEGWVGAIQQAKQLLR